MKEWVNGGKRQIQLGAQPGHSLGTAWARPGHGLGTAWAVCGAQSGRWEAVFPWAYQDWTGDPALAISSWASVVT